MHGIVPSWHVFMKHDHTEIDMAHNTSRPGHTSDPAHPQGTSETPSEHDPRAELGLKSPTKSAEEDGSKRQQAEGQKATQFDGNPSPQGAPSSALKPKDDTPGLLKKTKGPRDDQ